MTKISFIGDVMLGRLIGRRYAEAPYSPVDAALRDRITMADLVVANLESPVAAHALTEGDHLQFRGNPDILDELRWIQLFSLSNNHITDCGTEGITETISLLEAKGFQHNGIYSGEYKPYLMEHDGDRIAIVTATDMLNIPFAEQSPYRTLRVGDPTVQKVIGELRAQGYFVILYAHIGMLFTRYPNPFTRDYLQACADAGADLIVSAHSHCLGGMEEYKGKCIFYSLGDFVMDGNSFRRRRSAALQCTIHHHHLESWELIPAMIGKDLVTVIPPTATAQKMRRSFDAVSADLRKYVSDYPLFFKHRYRKEMVQHAASTLLFLIRQRGLSGMLKMVLMRFEEVFRMFSWVSKDRSTARRDDDAIKADRRKFKETDLFR